MPRTPLTCERSPYPTQPCCGSDPAPFRNALLGSIPEDAGDLPHSPEELRAAVEAACRNHDRETARRFTCWDGTDSTMEGECREAAKLLERNYLSKVDYRDCGPILNAFIHAGRPDAYVWLLGALADSTKMGGDGETVVQRRDYMARLCVESIIPPDAGYEYDLNGSMEARAAARQTILAWVEARLAGMTGKD